MCAEGKDPGTKARGKHTGIDRLHSYYGEIYKNSEKIWNKIAVPLFLLLPHHIDNEYFYSLKEILCE